MWISVMKEDWKDMPLKTKVLIVWMGMVMLLL